MGSNYFKRAQDGFSHNRLKPYKDWEAFRSEARRLWNIYRDVVNPEFIEILGLNYINSIGIPSGVEISDYLRAFIQVPPELPQVLEVHNFQVQMVDPVANARTLPSLWPSVPLMQTERSQLHLMFKPSKF